MPHHRLSLLAAAAVLAVTPAIARPVWILDTEYNEVRVVVSPLAAPLEHEAAVQFRDAWARYTGYTPEVGPEPVLGMVNVWIGRADNPFADSLEPATLGAEGFHIRTYDRSWRKRIRDHFGRYRSLQVQERYDLVIVGGDAGGALAGVRAFFERYMVDITSHQSPPPESIPMIDDRHVQPMVFIDDRTATAEAASLEMNEASVGWEETSQRAGSALALQEAEPAGSP